MTEQKRGRVNNSLLQPLERPTLAWLAARMPEWVTSDRLTCFGIFGSFVTFVGYGLTNWHHGFFLLASLGLVMNWFGDSLDGTLARYRRRERPRYGFFVDHTVDTFNELFIILGIGLTAFVRFEVACLVLIVYLMISVYAFVRTAVTNTLQITIGIVGGTEMRVALLFLNAIMFFSTPFSVITLWAPLSILDLVLLAGFAAALIALATLIIMESRRLAVEDPPRHG
jgi:phosphatidylglycerophosphate synthase